MAKENILVFCAHSDDTEIGCGGTILKYIKEDKNIVHTVFSYGEKSHPHLKEKIVAKKREKETNVIDKILGRKTIFLGLKEGKFKEDSEKTKKKIIEIIKKNKPSKIYTLCSLDPHPDHRAVNSLVIESIEEMKYKGDVYAFEVWNVINENKPVIYVDITDTFKEKINLLKHFKSQWLSIYIQLLPIMFRARLHGNKNNCKYAEKFYKLK
jgi:LmbE family N-acetylglucosaminyl deacetylase|tara:strand:- start:282 stop:911 length:630 start_codon:yes stop_codon:yes gene_type:complete